MIYLDCAAGIKPLYHSPTHWYHPGTTLGQSQVEELKTSLLNELGLPSSYNVYCFDSGTEANRVVINELDCWTCDMSHKSIAINNVVKGACNKDGSIDLPIFYDKIKQKVSQYVYPIKDEWVMIDIVNSELGGYTNINEARYIFNHLAIDITQDLPNLYQSAMYDMAEVITFSPSKIGVRRGIGIVISQPTIKFLQERAIPIELLDDTVYAIKKLKEGYNVSLYKAKRNALMSMQQHPNIKLIGGCDSHIFTFNVEDIDGNVLYESCIKSGLIVGRGSACNNGTSSYAYQTLGYNTNNVFRFSFSYNTPYSDVARGVKKFIELVDKLKRK